MIGSSDEVHTCSFLLSWNQEFIIIITTTAESMNYKFPFHMKFCISVFQETYWMTAWWYANSCVFVTNSHKNVPLNFEMSFCPFVYQTCWISFHEILYYVVWLKFVSPFQIWLALHNKNEYTLHALLYVSYLSESYLGWNLFALRVKREIKMPLLLVPMPYIFYDNHTN